MGKAKGSLQFKMTIYLMMIVICLMFSGSLIAQSYDNPSLGQKPIAGYPQDYKPLGVRAGSFMLHPGVELSGEWNDNVFYTYDNKISDTIFHIRPYINIQSSWSKHSLTVYLAADIARYSDRGILDYEDYFFNVAGTVDVKAQSYFSYGFDYMDLHEGRNFTGAEQGIEPTRYNLTGGYLGYDHVFNRLSVGGLIRTQKMDYKDSLALDGEIIDNQDRDRTLNNASIRFGYQFKTDKQAFLQAGWNDTNYKQTFDRNGYHRDSSGYDISAGILFNITAVLDGDISVIYHNREYDDPRLENIDGWAFGAGLHWYPTRLTSVHGTITSSIEDTTYEYSSGYLRTLYAVRVDHELLRDLQLSGDISYSQNDYTLNSDAPIDARTSDDYWRFGLGLNYYFNRYIRISASYDYTKLTSNLPRDGFDANRFWLTLGLER